jgi:hypothetical protein
LTYLGFVTEGKLAAVLIKPSLGVSNWPVIYTIQHRATTLYMKIISFVTHLLDVAFGARRQGGYMQIV